MASRLTVGKLAVIDGPFTVGVWLDNELIGKFKLLDDADTFRAGKARELGPCGAMVCARDQGHPGSHMTAEEWATAQCPVVGPIEAS